MPDDDDGAWFAAKRYGYGAGLPVRWQGWAVLAVFNAVVILAGLLLWRRHWALFAIVIAIDVAALILVTRGRTRGGWRWRMGGDR